VLFVVLEVDVEVTEVVEVVVVEQEVVVVEQEDVDAGTHETPLQVYPAPYKEVQYWLGNWTPPQPPTIGVLEDDQVEVARTHWTPLQVYAVPYKEAQY